MRKLHAYIIVILDIVLICGLPFAELYATDELTSPWYLFSTVECIGSKCEYQIQIDYDTMKKIKYFHLFVSKNSSSYDETDIRYIFKYMDDRKNKKLYILNKNNYDDEKYQYVILDYKTGTYNIYQQLNELSGSDMKIFESEKKIKDLYK